ncbi:SPOR domain-containing protein [Aliiroseovarius marinus]|uniref:SPOR domain-containing protein n=1 Tax=Aliiroseovarius marinus TaxID=2500159 RepID=UPI003D7E57B5
MAKKTGLAWAMMLGGAVVLSACDDTNLPGFLKNAKSGKPGATTTAGSSSKSVERDVEAPEVFKLSENGLWDGRPSLGGVWVAHPTAKDPERVIVRNEANGKFVIGALFRREKDLPGPRFQVSSDAATALGMLAGQPAKLTVTALKKETVTEQAEADQATAQLEAPDEITSGSLEDPIASAAAALDRAEGVAPSPKPAAKAAVGTAAAKPKLGGLAKPFIQIGIFSVEQNAKNSAEALRRAGMLPTVKPGKSSGKAFWRVVVGPATSSSERAALLKKIKGLGFSDAYFVTN